MQRAVLPRPDANTAWFVRGWTTGVRGEGDPELPLELDPDAEAAEERLGGQMDEE